MDLVENGEADEESDGEGLVQPVVVEVELVGKLHDLSPGGVGVRKWPTGHCDVRLKKPQKQKTKDISDFWTSSSLARSLNF